MDLYENGKSTVDFSKSQLEGKSTMEKVKQPQDLQAPGMKRINEPGKHRESIAIQFWHDEGIETKVETIDQMIPWGSGRYAVAAALKGIRKYFLSSMPEHVVHSDDPVEKVVEKVIEDNLAQWNALMAKAEEMRRQQREKGLGLVPVEEDKPACKSEMPATICKSGAMRKPVEIKKSAKPNKSKPKPKR